MLYVLGPQRPTPNVPALLAGVEGEGPVVVIAAGWRHNETDDEVLRRHLGPDVAVLPLYTWFEVVSREMPEVRKAWRARQEDLIALKALHRRRLHPALEVVRDLRSEDHADPLVASMLRAAMRHVREVDGELLVRSEEVALAHAGGGALGLPGPSTGVVGRLRERARKVLQSARAVVLTGGHVGVLHNRLHFFGVDRVLEALHQADRPIFAWSAGAMALSERIVLFYDDPPDGPSYPEVFARGVGLIPGAVLLPHARQRLKLDDQDRVALLAQRFAPAACLGLENGACVERVEGRWINRGVPGSALRLLPSGRVENVEQQ